MSRREATTATAFSQTPHKRGVPPSQLVNLRNDIAVPRHVSQLVLVNLDLDSPRLKQAMEVLGVTPD